MYSMMDINWIDFIGFVSGAVLLWGMFKRTIIVIRLSLVFGNIGFILFGYFADSHPTLFTHAALLPLNAVRLYQVWHLVRVIRDTRTTDMSLDELLPYMTGERLAAGQVLFNRGDKSDRMIVIKEGKIRLRELDIVCGPGTMLGEVAAFAPDSRRTATAVAETDCHLFSLDNEALLQIFYQNPDFGLYLIRTIVHRLLENWQNAEERAMLT